MDTWLLYTTQLHVLSHYTIYCIDTIRQHMLKVPVVYTLTYHRERHDTRRRVPTAIPGCVGHRMLTITETRTRR
jgi:hypothetical protein